MEQRSSQLKVKSEMKAIKLVVVLAAIVVAAAFAVSKLDTRDLNAVVIHPSDFR